MRETEKKTSEGSEKAEPLATRIQRHLEGMDCDREFSLDEHGTGSTAQEAEHELTSPPFVAGVSGSPRRARECENFPVRQSTSLEFEVF
jgi:hypothetical protein